MGAPEISRCFMSLLDTQTTTLSDGEHAANRVCPVTVKLTQDEHREVTEHAEGLGQARSEWMRDVILRELRSEPTADPSLAEILGVRLLLVNVLRPLAAGQSMSLEAFDKLLDQISTLKHEMAGKLLAEGRR
ncbi:hypothetical protein [Terriglobus sp. ADX1]|uniref:hypothetical protein n=1 Tax=Terriglobus sp. ADX1 TaxID=2794063 RepID=UPI002FE5F76C